MQIQEAIRGVLGWAWIFLQEDWWFLVIIVTLFSLTVKKVFERLVEKRLIWTWIILFAIGVILFFAIVGYWLNGDAFL